MAKTKRANVKSKKGTSKQTVPDNLVLHPLIQSLSSPISIFDGLKNEFIYFNSQFSLLTGYSQEELSNLDVKGFIALIHARDLAVVINKVSERVHEACIEYIRKKKQQVCFSLNYRLQHKKGHYIHVIVQNTVLQWNHAQNMSTTLSLFTNVNHLKDNPVIFFTIDSYNPAHGQWKNVYSEEFRPQPEMLSEREREVMSLMVQGINTGNVSRRLDMNYYTVRSHWRNIMRKTKCKSQQELKELAKKEGWI